MWDTVQYCIFALAQKDYVKNTRNGGKWRWEILALKIRGEGKG
jgi:hypothetical protein